MFCSSLRRRPDFMTVVPALLRAKPTGWRETNLDGCNIALPMSTDGNGRTYRILLLPTTDVGKASTAESIARLQHLDGGQRVGIIVLLTGDDAAANFAKLQKAIFESATSVALVPVSNVQELPQCIEHWHRQLLAASSRPSTLHASNNTKTLVSHCVLGLPLAERQTNILMDICSGFRELGQSIIESEGSARSKLEDYLGEVDGRRIVDFLKGPT